jgi:hypothetical protein
MNLFKFYSVVMLGLMGIFATMQPILAVSWIGSTMSIGDGNLVYVTSNAGAGNGYVGIGTSIPGYSLTVSGNMRVHGTVTGIEYQNFSQSAPLTTGTATINWARGNKQALVVSAANTGTITLSFDDPPGPALLLLLVHYLGAAGTLTFPTTVVEWPVGTRWWLSLQALKWSWCICFLMAIIILRWVPVFVRNVWVGVVVAIFLFGSRIVATSNSYFDPTGLVMEDRGLVVTQNARVGVGTAVPKFPLEVSGNVSISGSLSYDSIANTVFDIDWSTANIQTLSITASGVYGINFTVSPTSNANLSLIIKYTALSPGQLTFSYRGHAIYWVGGSTNGSTFYPVTGTTDVFHFYYRKLYDDYFGYPLVHFK